MSDTGRTPEGEKSRENSHVTSEHGDKSLFQDKYGILKLAAHTALERRSKSHKGMQWANTILRVVKQLWKNNGITMSDLLWIDASDFTYSIIWEKHRQKGNQE